MIKSRFKMHGRLKVKSTAQQEAERKAAKEKEKQQYQVQTN